jgi:hypothetical protein
LVGTTARCYQKYRDAVVSRHHRLSKFKLARLEHSTFDFARVARQRLLSIEASASNAAVEPLQCRQGTHSKWAFPSGGRFSRNHQPFTSSGESEWWSVTRANFLQACSKTFLPPRTQVDQPLHSRFTPARKRADAWSRRKSIIRLPFDPIYRDLVAVRKFKFGRDTTHTLVFSRQLL